MPALFDSHALMGRDLLQEGVAQACHGSFSPDDIFPTTSLVDDVKLARLGNLGSTLRVGFAHYTGMAGCVDLTKARQCFVAASSCSFAGYAWLGYLDAAAHVWHGPEARSNPTFQGLVDASDSGDPVGQTLMGLVFEHGLAGYKPRIDKAEPLYRAAAPYFALAKTYLGRLLRRVGDDEQAMSLFKDAAAAGDTAGMIALADMYSEGPTRNIAEMKLLLRSAATKNDHVALYLLGVQYQHGTLGFKADSQRAFNLLHKSATIGNKAARRALANAYVNGKGPVVSPESARFWLRKAAAPVFDKRQYPASAGN